jgi:hypothetical protein
MLGKQEEERRLNRPPTIHRRSRVSPPRSVSLAPQAPPVNRYVAPANVRAFLIRGYLRWRRRAPIGIWPTPALARPRLTM